MLEVPTVGIPDLCPLKDPRDALNNWDGFAAVVSGEVSPAGSPVLLMDDAGGDRWRWLLSSRPQPVSTLGCYFIRDLNVSGSGYLFHGERFVREHTHTSDVGLQWLQREDYPDNPLVLAPPEEIAVEAPCLVVIGPGFPIWGHWLLDFLPRIAIAQRLLGTAIADFMIPLPADSPDWLPEMLAFFCGVSSQQILRFDRHAQRVLCRRACVPSVAHNGHYVPHSFLTSFYDRFIPGDGRAGSRRICISRSNFERQTRGVWRIFESRLRFEDVARYHGYEIVRSEELAISEQIALFAEAGIIVGEHGSGMHNAIFSGRGTAVGCIAFSNAIQFLIGARRGHTNVYMNRLLWRTDERGILHYEARPELIEGFFEVMNLIEAQHRVC
jgi:capsular polysaccharide biosynthesis protein